MDEAGISNQQPVDVRYDKAEHAARPLRKQHAQDATQPIQGPLRVARQRAEDIEMVVFRAADLDGSNAGQ